MEISWKSVGNHSEGGKSVGNHRNPEISYAEKARVVPLDTAFHATCVIQRYSNGKTCLPKRKMVSTLTSCYVDHVLKWTVRRGVKGHAYILRAEDGEPGDEAFPAPKWGWPIRVERNDVITLFDGGTMDSLWALTRGGCALVSCPDRPAHTRKDDLFPS